MADNLLVDIWRVMNQSGVTKAEMARRIKRSRAHVSEVLNGKRAMTLPTLSALASAIGCEVMIILQPRNNP